MYTSYTMVSSGIVVLWVTMCVSMRVKDDDKDDDDDDGTDNSMTLMMIMITTVA